MRTGSDWLWVYHQGTDGEPKYLRAAHLRRWERQHRRHLLALADDLKHEKRWPADVRRQANERQDIWVRKYRDRLDSFCHEATAMLAKFAERSNVATVVYDDTDQSYLDRFPWRKLRDQLQSKLDERSIALEVVPAPRDTDGGDDQANGRKPPTPGDRRGRPRTTRNHGPPQGPAPATADARAHRASGGTLGRHGDQGGHRSAARPSSARGSLTSRQSVASANALDQTPDTARSLSTRRGKDFRRGSVLTGPIVVARAVTSREMARSIRYLQAHWRRPAQRPPLE